MGDRSKYNVGKTPCERTYDDIVFDSILEMKYYRDVILPSIKNGEIVCCERQKKYTLQPVFYHNGKCVKPIEYKADFYIVDKDGKESVIDIKGCPDSVAKLKRKLFWFTYPNLNYIWVGYSKIDGGWILYEDISHARAQRKKNKAQKLKEIKEQNEKSKK